MELYSILTTLSLTVFITFPGLVFRRIYFQHEFSKQFSSTNWNASLTFSAFFGVIVTIITLNFFKSFTYFDENLVKLTYIKNCVIEGQFNEIIKLKYISTITWYITISVFIAITLGHILYKLIRITNLDKIITFLRFENHWHYYFTGESLEFSSFKNIRKHNYSPDSTLAEVSIINSDQEQITYRGQLQQHTISKKNGDLELIYLIYPAIKKENNYLLVNDCDILLLPYRNVLDIKLNYYYEKNIDRLKTLKILKILLWILYSSNIILFLFNSYNHKLIFSITLAVFYHISFYFLINLFKSIYEAHCLKKETIIKKQKNNLQIQNSYTKVFAYSIILLLIFFLIKLLYNFG